MGINWRLFNTWEMKFPVYLLTLISLSSEDVRLSRCLGRNAGVEIRRSYECSWDGQGRMVARCSGSISNCFCNEANVTYTAVWEYIDGSPWTTGEDGGWDCSSYCTWPWWWFSMSGTLETETEQVPDGICCRNTCNYNDCRYDFIQDGSGRVSARHNPNRWATADLGRHGNGKEVPAVEMFPRDAVLSDRIAAGLPISDQKLWSLHHWINGDCANHRGVLHSHVI